MALFADLLTASRLVLAIVVGASLAGSEYRVAVIFLVCAWATDFFDGILARAASRPTRLGDWDFRVDVTIGIAILAGLAVADVVPAGVAIAAVLLGAGWTQLTGNPAPAMLLMALAYGWLLTLLLVDQPSLWWLPFVAIAILLILQWRRFFRTILPAFFGGMTRLAQGGDADTPPVLDRWA